MRTQSIWYAEAVVGTISITCEISLDFTCLLLACFVTTRIVLFDGKNF